jgi:hypothetical protein
MQVFNGSATTMTVDGANLTIDLKVKAYSLLHQQHVYKVASDGMRVMVVRTKNTQEYDLAYVDIPSYLLEHLDIVYPCVIVDAISPQGDVITYECTILERW